MTLTQLRYFIAIADSGFNITVAAERVHATQPGLSKQLKQLEDELGFQLFARKGRSLDALTAPGEQVLQHARKLLAEAGNIRAYAANEQRQDSGRLAIATTQTQAQHVLPAAIARLKQRYPQVSVHLRPGDEGEALLQLASGEADLAVISSVGAAPVGQLAIPLYRWRRLLLASRAHPIAVAGATPGMALLAQQPLVSYESSIRPESSLQQAFAAAGLVPRIAMTARDADLIKTYVRAGLGIGLLAEMAINTDVDADLVALPAPEEIPQCTTWAILPRKRVLRSYVLELLYDLAPQLDRHDLRRALQGHIESPQWPAPPDWAELSQAINAGDRGKAG